MGDLTEIVELFRRTLFAFTLMGTQLQGLIIVVASFLFLCFVAKNIFPKE